MNDTFKMIIKQRLKHISYSFQQDDYDTALLKIYPNIIWRSTEVDNFYFQHDDVIYKIVNIFII